MAKVKYTAVVADMRNKLNGSVFSKNRGGAYVRTKVTPVNRQTSFQSAVRNRLGTYAQGFRSLTASQIAAWNSAVDNFKGTDIFGDIKTPSGIDLYIKLNTNLQLAGASPLVLPPLPQSVEALSLTELYADENAQAIDLITDPDIVPVDHALVVSATKQRSPGVSFFGGQYTFMIVFPATVSVPYSLTTEYTDKYGALVAGQKLSVQVQYINTVTGQTGIPVHKEAIVTN